MWPALAMALLTSRGAEGPQPTVREFAEWMRARALPAGVQMWWPAEGQDPRSAVAYVSDDGSWNLRRDGLLRQAGEKEIAPDPIPRPRRYPLPPGVPRDPAEEGSGALRATLAAVARRYDPESEERERAEPGSLAAKAMGVYLSARWEDVLRAFVAGDDALARERLRRWRGDWLDLRFRFGRGWHASRTLTFVGRWRSADAADLGIALEHPRAPEEIPAEVRDLDRIRGYYAIDARQDPIYVRLLAANDRAAPALRWAAEHDRRVVRWVFTDLKETGAPILLRVRDVARDALARKKHPGIILITRSPLSGAKSSL